MEGLLRGGGGAQPGPRPRAPTHTRTRTSTHTPEGQLRTAVASGTARAALNYKTNLNEAARWPCDSDGPTRIKLLPITPSPSPADFSDLNHGNVRVPHARDGRHFRVQVGLSLDCDTGRMAQAGTCGLSTVTAV